MKHLAICLVTILFAACSTSVITDEDRALPPAPVPDQVLDEDMPMEDASDHEADQPMPDAGEAEEEMDDELENDDDEMEGEPEENDNEMEDGADEDDDTDEAAEPVAAVLQADLSQSFIAFTGKKGDLVSHEGKFNRFTVEVNTVDDVPLSMNASIDIASMETDSDRLTDHLQAPDFFDAATHGTATFRSSTVTSLGDSRYTVSGPLTIKGVTNDVSFTAEMNAAYLLLSYNLDRTAFGVGPAPEGVKAIDAVVPIEAKIVFAQ